MLLRWRGSIYCCTESSAVPAAVQCSECGVQAGALPNVRRGSLKNSPCTVINTPADPVTFVLDEYGRLLRRTLIRYVNLTSLLIFRSVSTAVCKRFPTMEHVVEAGFMTQEERKVYENIRSPHLKYWIPVVWFSNLAVKAREEGRIKDSIDLQLIHQEMNVFRTWCATLFGYDWVGIPLVYTQEPSGEQPFTANKIGNHNQILSFTSCLPVLQVSLLAVDEMHMNLPHMTKDIYWNDSEARPPYTLAAADYCIPSFLGSTTDMGLTSLKFPTNDNKTRCWFGAKSRSLQIFLFLDLRSNDTAVTPQEASSQTSGKSAVTLPPLKALPQRFSLDSSSVHHFPEMPVQTLKHQNLTMDWIRPPDQLFRLLLPDPAGTKGVSLDAPPPLQTSGRQFSLQFSRQSSKASVRSLPSPKGLGKRKRTLACFQSQRSPADTLQLPDQEPEPEYDNDFQGLAGTEDDEKEETDDSEEIKKQDS
ncbi:hypothetical protein F7725_022112 [Dissostichus mawsoni]|uniref:Bestrophin homolog n=1 Tax=Dissostichus mawsoni TaxID=36200 RepID=A0A7J5ZDQ0_DISMA|nr:hypothetical protein F7725_022112 [Dissostichus mawsoni]